MDNLDKGILFLILSYMIPLFVFMYIDVNKSLLKRFKTFPVLSILYTIGWIIFGYTNIRYIHP